MHILLIQNSLSYESTTEEKNMASINQDYKSILEPVGDHWNYYKSCADRGG